MYNIRMSTCINGCDRKVYAKGICSRCYDRKRKPPGTTYKKRLRQCYWQGCEVKGDEVCPGRIENRFCPRHFLMMWLDPTVKPTHRHLTNYGYVMLTVLGKPVREHRLVMERHLGRRLTDKENVHHIDGNRENNSLSNLELWTEEQPSGQRVSDKIRFALDIINKYGDNPDAF